MQRIILIFGLLIVALGWAGWSLKAASSGAALGHPPQTAPAATIAAVRRNPQAFAGKTICLTGRMTERCPTAGCWFDLDDGTGSLRVDAGAGGFSVSGLPMGARLKAFGRVEAEPGEDPQLVAVGVRS
jgi:hypothetical protein